MRIALLLSFSALVLWAQEAPTFRTGVSLVHVDAEVIGQDGRILGGLQQQDFRVFDSGKEQPVLYFGSGEEPLDLILLFDVSGSMLPKVKAVSEAAAEGMRELRPGDRVLLMAFNKGSRVILPFTDDLKRVEEAIRTDVLSLDFDGPTFLQDAVDDAATILLKQPRQRGRRAVLAITDNLAARTSRETAIIRRLWEADGILSGLVLYDAEWEKARKPGRLPKVEDLGVAPIVQKTGGDFIYSGDATSALVEAMRRIRTRYSLYYALPKRTKGRNGPSALSLPGERRQETRKPASAPVPPTSFLPTWNRRSRAVALIT